MTGLRFIQDDAFNRVSNPSSSIDREKLDLWCERGVFGLVVAILVYSPLVLGAARAFDFLVIEWLTVALLGVWGCRFIINPKHRLLWPWLCWPVLGFMLYAAGRCWMAGFDELARQELSRVLIYGFIFFAVLNNLHRLETVQLVGTIVLSVGTLLAMYAIVQYLTGSDYVWGYERLPIYEGRGSGTFMNPNHLAGYLEMLLPLALAYTLTSRLKEIGKVLVGYAVLVIFAGLVVTFSRWGWLAAGLSVVIWLAWMMRQHQYRLPGLLILTGFLVVIFVLGVLLRPAKAKIQANRLDRAAQAEDVHFKTWAPAVEFWKEHLWLGAGPGGFDARHPEYREAVAAPRQMPPERVHNDYLNVLMDWGLAGGLLLAAVWVCFYAGIARSWKYVHRTPNDLKAKRSNKTSFVLGGALGLLAILIHSWLETNLYVPANALLAAVLLGLVSGHFRFATEKYWHTVRWGLRVPVALALAAGLAFLGAHAWRHTF